MEEYIRTSIEIEFDELNISKKLYIINKFYLLPSEEYNKYQYLNNENIKVNNIIDILKIYITSNILENEYNMKMIILEYSNKLNCIIYDKNKWIEASEAYITLFTPLIKERADRFKKNSLFNNSIGLNINKNNKIIFKIKDTTNLDVHNKGWACNNLKKNNIKDILNHIFDNHNDIDLLINNPKYKIFDLCNLIKFIFVYFNIISVKQKIWFINSMDTAIIKFTNTFKI